MWRKLKGALETRAMRERVRAGGWGIRFVRGDQPSVACSVGLAENAKAPEVCVSGLPEDVSVEMIECARDQIRAGELTLTDGAEWPWNPDSEEGPFLVWRAVHPDRLSAEVFEPALHRWVQRGMRRQDFRAYQLVIADDAERFPWEDGFNEAFRPLQQHLYLPGQA